MKIIRDLNNPIKIDKPVLTIGKMDGIHLGHKKLTEEVTRYAEKIGGTSCVFTFNPHPKQFFKKNGDFELITTQEQKLEILIQEGIDILFVQKFDEEFRSIKPEDFVKDILVKKIGIHTLVFGKRFSFGASGEGDYKLMKSLGKKYGFNVIIVDPVKKKGKEISSTSVRNAIRAGDMTQATILLGRDYYIDGKVIHGSSRGHKLLYPTANIQPVNKLLPPAGVYITYIEIENEKFRSVTNIGNRPTFDDGNFAIESYVIDQDFNLYDKTVRLFFLKRIRDEQPFSNADELKAKMKEDIEEAVEYFDRGENNK
ncbi:MAG: bifunctional riboflavin kinase/FAD synthetase [Acidobacteria bacterium]|nr:bifunctional riboflavin kinase/FAD synthetase [Acidobacteriota bacterium]